MSFFLSDTIKVRSILLLAFLLTVSGVLVNSQDLEKIRTSKIIEIHGGLDAQYSFASSTSDSYNPYPSIGSINGNLDFNILGVLNIPFSFYLGTNNKSFNQPSFRQFGVSPRYKFLTLHLGYRSLNFSNYSMNGLTFFGAAAELALPGDFVRITIMEGRFRKKISASDSSRNQLPCYERNGCGGKIEFGKSAHKLALVLFKSQDRFTDGLKIDSNFQQPSANLLMAINSSNKFKEFLSLNAEYTISLVTDNFKISQDENRYKIHLPVNFFPVNSSSHYAQVISMNIETKILNALLGLSFLHIDPDFISFGCPYVNNDIENYLFHMDLPVFKNRVHLSSQFGFERNNLRKLSGSKTQRVIIAGNANIKLSEKLNASLQYSNFNSSSRPSMIRVSDSLICLQSSGNLQFVVNYNGKGQSVNFIANRQLGKTVNYLGSLRNNSISTLTAISIFYNIELQKLNESISTGISINYFDLDRSVSSTLGPSINLNQSLLNGKIRLGSTYSYLLSKINSAENFMHSVRLNAGFTAGLAGSFQASAIFNDASSTSGVQAKVKIQNFRFQLGYSNSF